ncbi:MAG: DUF4468 domain-containing protein [Fibrobacteres bacterium]|nr:DUF4468 domain-containing protein [Fibrobacterota bacterium]
MKSVSIVLTIFLAIIMCNCAGTVRPGYDADDEQSREYVFSTQLSKLDEYNNALIYISNIYNSANSVIQLKDPNAGVIVVKAQCPFNIMGYTRYVYYTMEARFKDQKAKITFNLSGIAGGGGFYAQPDYAPPKEQMPYVWNNLDDIASGLKSAMQKKDDF